MQTFNVNPAIAQAGVQKVSTVHVQANADRRTLLTVVTPAYNEADNLPVLYERLRETLLQQDLEWEWVVVDDHSTDDTFNVLEQLAQRDARVRAVRLARNFGSHTAIACGLHHAHGDCAAVMAADLQDPPEVILQLLSEWHAGGQVIWAVRGKREGESGSKVSLSRLYYFLMRHVVGIREIPSNGADFLLIDRLVINAFCQFDERNVSVMALITWMGFRQTSIVYTKRARLSGKSGWTLKKKLKLVVDSVTSFTYLPIRVMSYTGFGVAFLGLLYAAFVVVHTFRGSPPTGWSSLMVLLLVLGGLQMMMLGVLGEYLWRVLDESRRRPRYLIEAESGSTS